jgi:Ca-activated chloride channel family protein
MARVLSSSGVWKRGASLVLVALAVAGLRGQDAPRPSRPMFRSGVDLVSVAAVVRDRRGEVIRTLTRADFEVYDNGVLRPIVEFSPAEEGPVSLALLVDVSGSMAVASNLTAARRTIDHLVAWLKPGADEVGVFAFARELREMQGFTNEPARVQAALVGLEAYGTTSLYDAIDDVARQLAGRPTRRRAIVVLTDGLDNASRLSAAQVSGVAAGSDVPVYVVAVMSPLDDATSRAYVGSGSVARATGALEDLARWTGGQAFVVSDDAQASVAARRLLVELRHQYLLAFESVGAPGWRPLDVRIRRRGDWSVSARSGYFASQVRPIG